MPSFCKLLGRVKRFVDHDLDPDHGGGVARTLDVGETHRDGVVAVRDRAFDEIELLVLEEDDRVVVADGGLEQALGVGRGGGHADLQAGDVGEPGLQRLRVLGGVAAAAALLGPNDHRQGDFAAEHVAHLGGLVGDRLHAEAQKVGVHDLADWAGAGRGGANGQRGDRFLGDRRVANSLEAELVDQSLGYAKDAAAAPDGDVLAEDENGRVAPHLLAQRLVERLGVG